MPSRLVTFVTVVLPCSGCMGGTRCHSRTTGHCRAEGGYRRKACRRAGVGPVASLVKQEAGFGADERMRFADLREAPGFTALSKGARIDVNEDAVAGGIFPPLSVCSSPVTATSIPWTSCRTSLNGKATTMRRLHEHLGNGSKTSPTGADARAPRLPRALSIPVFRAGCALCLHRDWPHAVTGERMPPVLADAVTRLSL